MKVVGSHGSYYLPGIFVKHNPRDPVEEQAKISGSTVYLYKAIQKGRYAFEQTW